MRRMMIASMVGAALIALPSVSQAQIKTGDAATCALGRPEHSRFSGAVAITHNGISVFSERGVMAASGSAPITPAARFNIGSAGKMFTAVAVAQLVDAGKMKLDDPVGKYVDGLTPGAARVTLRQLLTHTGGLGNFFTPDAVSKLQHISAMHDLMQLIAGDTPHFTPGSRFEYSNTGFALLGLAVERASAESYDAYLSSHIFTPAGMTASGMAFADGTTAVGATGESMLQRNVPPPGSAGGTPRGEAPRRLPPLRAGSGGDPSQGGEGTPDRDLLHPAAEARLPATPAGGLFSTAGDLTRFFQALASGKLIRPDTLRVFTTRQVESAPPKGNLPALFYGFGFGTGSFDGHRWFGHNGGAPGVNAEAIMFPDDDLIIVVLSNRDPPSATTLFQALRESIFRGGC